MKKQNLSTPIGDFTAVWTLDGLQSFEFDRQANPLAHRRHSNQVVTKPASSPSAPLEAELVNALQHYFDGGIFTWDLSWLDWSGVSEFHQRVLRACFEIPCGQTATYQQLASQVGSPKAARAVGGAMARNRWPILIPCHRVVGANGKMVGYSGVGGTQTKQKLLAMEKELAQARGEVSRNLVASVC